MPGGIINWYTSAQSNIPIITTSQVSSGTYYVEQVIDQCSSARVQVQIQIISITAPNLTNITVCSGTTLSDFNSNTNAQAKYLWYSDNTSTVSLTDNHVIQSGDYYIAHEISGCISDKTKVNVIVNPRPTNPTGQTIQTFNYAATIANLQMN